MNRNERSKYQAKYRGWAVILVSVAALALSGCGRKGPLDLPPTASSQAPLAAAPGEPAVADQASKPNLFNSSYGANSPPPTPKGPKRPFVLDPLLDSN